MRLRNMIISGALVLAVSSLAACADHNMNSAEAKTTYKVIPTLRVKPMYPPIAQYEGVEGNVTVRFTVKVNGSVGNAQVAKAKFWTASGKAPTSGAEQALEKMAITSMEKSKFEPRRSNGKPVPSETFQTIKFRIGSPPNTKH